MRLASVRIQNFRAFADETIRFNDYTCLVGPNGGGKSTVLTALNIFFRQTSHSQTDLLKLDIEDFHHKNTKDPIAITVTFDQLSDQAKEDFRDYFRQDKLIVTAEAVWSDDDNVAQVLQYGQRLGMKDFKPFFKAAGDATSVAELKLLYGPLRDTYADLPVWSSKQAIVDALHAYEAARPDKCVLIPSQDQFYGVSKGANRLEKYIQWIFVPAVKDASDEQLEAKNTALGMLLERSVRTKVTFKEPLHKLREELGDRYQKILDEQRGALAELSESLNERLGQWAHPDTSLALEWQNDQQNSIRIAEPLAQIIAGEGVFKGKLARFGHGLQRSFFLALLEELSGHDADTGPKLILGCEEPELYQHPPQARYLASVIQNLSSKNSQVIVCTHSPYFVTGRDVEDVRSIRPESSRRACVCGHVTLDQIHKAIHAARGEAPTKPTGTMLKVHQALQPALNEIFFTNVLILVEGLEDVAYISTYLTLMDKWDEFRRLGCHLVPAGGKSSICHPLVIANQLGIPTFVVFDSDRHSNLADPADNQQQKARKDSTRPKHQKDNLAILKLCGAPSAEAFPVDTMWQANVVMWNSEMGAVVTEDIGSDDWTNIAETVRRDHGIDVGDINKNALFIGYRLAKAFELNKRSPTLEKLCNAIIAFAAAARRTPGMPTPAEAAMPAELTT